MDGFEPKITFEKKTFILFCVYFYRYRIDNFYEPPTKLQTPPVPTTKRPPIRVIDDMEAYEDPDDFVPEKPVKVTLSFVASEGYLY